MEKVKTMKHDQMWITMTDDKQVNLHKWYQEGEQPKAIVQIAHGMAEHMDRYSDFAVFLVKNNVFVYGNDHRGHGKTGKRTGQLGFLAEKDGFERITDDLLAINEKIHHDYPNVPVFLLGHSMGSFLARRYIQKYPDTVTGVILSGTAGDPGVLGQIGIWLAKWEMKKYGIHSPSAFLNELIFGQYNKRIKKKRTDFDWLTRDKRIVQSYIQDPLCGFICTTSFYYELLSGLKLIHNPEEMGKTPKDLPMFIFSGAEDPVGNYGKGVQKVIQQYEDIGMTVEWKIFPEARHEMLNELNRHEVYEMIIEWINRHASVKKN